MPQIVRMHRYERAGQEGVPVPLDDTGVQKEQEADEDPNKATPMYV